MSPVRAEQTHTAQGIRYSQKEGGKDNKQRFPKIDKRYEVRDLIGLQIQAKNINLKKLPNKITPSLQNPTMKKI